jgi:drug/metabolite transporter (DMT)-like permease
LLTLIWGSNWVVMKLALQSANPVVLNVQRTWLATPILFAVLFWRRGPLLPESWIAVIVTGIFQTTINFGSTTMALAAAAPDARQCWCSPCRSGRCYSRGRSCTSV